MTIYTRISFGSEHQNCYINKTAYSCLSGYMSLHPAQVTLLEDEVDFVLSKESVYPKHYFQDADTLIMTADVRGVTSSMRCHYKIGKRVNLPLSSGLHRSALTSCCITRFNSYPIDVGIFDDEKPVDVILRTNRKLVKCTSHGQELNITMEKHWRGPWSNPDMSRIYFVKEPVYFIEIEAEGDASIDTCKQWISTLLPQWVTLN